VYYTPGLFSNSGISERYPVTAFAARTVVKNRLLDVGYWHEAAIAS